MTRHLFLLAAALGLTLSCKTPGGSTLRSIGSEDANGGVVIFQADSQKAYRRACADAAAAMNPAGCPTREKSLTDFRAGLAGQGLNAGDIDEVVKLLANWRTYDAEESKVKSVITVDNLNIAFGINSQGAQGWVGGQSGAVSVPPPATTDTPLAKADVLNAMGRIRSKFNMDLDQYVKPCLANDTPHWSDIVIHYYCQLGQPRACFTPKARAYTKDLAGYEKAYTECQDETQNHASNQFDWVVKDQSDVFRYIMYSVYTAGRTKTFRQEDQDEVINAYYGVKDPEDANECNKRPRRFNESRPAGQHCGKRPASWQPATPPPQPVVVQPQPQPQPVVVQPQPQPQPVVNTNACNKYSGVDTPTNRIACKSDPAGCNWDYGSKKCWKTSGPDCEYYTSLGMDSADVRIACKNHPMKCDWTYSGNKCFRLKAGYCSYYNGFGDDTGVRLACMSNGCKWDYSAKRCN